MFDLKNDLSIFTSQNYENWENFQDLVQTRCSAENDTVILDSTIKVYLINSFVVHTTIEIGGVIFPPYRLGIVRSNKKPSTRVLFSGRIVEETCKDQLSLHKTAIVEIPYQAEFITAELKTLAYKENIVSPDRQMAKLALENDNDLSYELSEFYADAVFGAFNMTLECVDFLMNKLYGVSPRISSREDIKLLDGIPKTTFGITKCEVMEAFLECLRGIEITNENIEKLLRLFKIQSKI